MHLHFCCPFVFRRQCIVHYASENKRQITRNYIAHCRSSKREEKCGKKLMHGTALVYRPK